MDQSRKDELLQQAQEHVEETRTDIREEIEETHGKIEQLERSLQSGARPDEQVILARVLRHKQDRSDELAHLYPSPYFLRCDLDFGRGDGGKTVYFGKFGLPERSVYSWTAPAAAIRFEAAGDVSYRLPDGERRQAVMSRKDQFMVVDGRVVFMATESIGSPRELVHQERLSRRKTAFMLPEIVEVMEKAQDTVIRADHRGPFLIAGPAGSGKTTLALHRVAYLVQSPDTAETFDPGEAVVFVQDSATREYFAALLPELGIKDVTITTFADWAGQALGIEGIGFVSRFGRSERERDLLEYAKHRVLLERPELGRAGDAVARLDRLYRQRLTGETLAAWTHQVESGILDRHDVTLLLLDERRRKGELAVERTLYRPNRNGTLRKVVRKVPLSYSLLIVDEAQNYLPEQLEILRELVRPEPGAMLFVGDLRQQTCLYTLRDWSEAGVAFPPDRKVTLHKVYRNTRQIVEYVASLGFDASVAEGLRSGPPVVERTAGSTDEELEYVAAGLDRTDDAFVGVLAKSPEYLEPFRRRFGRSDNVRVLTVQESQGVEFDRVFLVGMGVDFLPLESDTAGYPADLLAERAKVDRDLLYLALTRAMDELHVVGRRSLKELMV
ncbi:MAG: AAA family ATPase [bacterium]